MDEAPVLSGPLNSSPADVPDLFFHASAYSREVQRATAAREWERGPWQTALLLDKYLSADPWALGHPDLVQYCELGWVEPVPDDPAAFRVTIWDLTLTDGIAVTLAVDAGTPGQQARQMASFLTGTPRDLWPVTGRVRRDG
jgi:hypothetical protein